MFSQKNIFLGSFILVIAVGVTYFISNLHPSSEERGGGTDQVAQVFRSPSLQDSGSVQDPQSIVISDRVIRHLSLNNFERFVEATPERFAMSIIPQDLSQMTFGSGPWVRNLKFGMYGDDVRLLQSILATKGYDLVVTGIFDTSTENAVKQLQLDNNLTSDGVFGSRGVASLSQDNGDSPYWGDADYTGIIEAVGADNCIWLFGYCNKARGSFSFGGHGITCACSGSDVGKVPGNQDPQLFNGNRIPIQRGSSVTEGEALLPGRIR